MGELTLLQLFYAFFGALIVAGLAVSAIMGRKIRKIRSEKAKKASRVVDLSGGFAGFEPSSLSAFRAGELTQRNAEALLTAIRAGAKVTARKPGVSNDTSEDSRHRPATS
ncbi:hypothetical protein [Chromobacterium phragmitis]|uniref:Uncharacterized protein n=1 Tax=Chromobacterium phragmitis TaxID=2202141 RepID=A0ABV0J0N3_9NEIS